jgi:hypothetical protein
MGMKEEKIKENRIIAGASITAESQVNMTKIEKMTKYIIQKFGVYTKIFKSGGRWAVMLEDGYIADGKKMKEVRDYVISHAEELEEDDNI